MTTLETLLHQHLAMNQLNLANITEQQLLQFLTLMQKWNQVFNLTAIRDPEEMVRLHILDSLSISPYLHGDRLIDVGTGAGLPGIPLALLFPQKFFVLLDSNGKKTRFLTQVVHELKLKNVEVVHGRCERFHPETRFDSIVSRAFSSLQTMLLTTHHLLADDGQFLAMKGVYPEQEIQHIPDAFKLLAIHTLTIKGLAAERCLVCIGKDSHRERS